MRWLGGRYTRCKPLVQRVCPTKMILELLFWLGHGSSQICLSGTGGDSPSKEGAAQVWECAQMPWGNVRLEWKDLFLHRHPSSLPASPAPPACGGYAACCVRSIASCHCCQEDGRSSESVESKQAFFQIIWPVWDIYIMLHPRSHFLSRYRITRVTYTPCKGPGGTSALQV